MISIFSKELKTYMTSMFTYIYFMLFFCVTGIYTYTGCVATSSTEFGFRVLTKSIIVVIFFIPLCTMRLFAQEKKERTDQMLFTAPVSNLSILCGKAFATLLVVVLPILISVFIPIYMTFYGTVSAKYIVAAYIACISITVVFVMLGIVVSILSSNGILAAVLTYAIYAVILVMRVVEGSIHSKSITHFINDYSYYNRLNDMVAGVIRSRDLWYFVATIVFLFAVSWICLDARRNKWNKNVFKLVTVFVACFAINGIGVSSNEIYDFTADQILTLSKETKDTVRGITGKTTIYYLGKESRANVTYKELLNHYAQLNENIDIQYEELSSDSKLIQTYLNALGSINEASLLVMSEEKYTFLDSKDYVSESYASSYTTRTLLNFENLLTGAINYVNSNSEETVLNLNSNGEDNLTASFENTVLLNGYELKNVNIEEEVSRLQSAFDDENKLAFIYAPDEDYDEKEIALLKHFLEKGGNLFVSLDPLNEDTPNLYSFLEEYGLCVQSGIIYETEAAYCMNNMPYYVIPHMKKNRFTADMQKDKAQVITMTSKGIICRDTKNGYTASDVLITTDDAFSKVDNFDSSSIEMGENDIGGPFAIAAVSEKDGAGSIFVLGSNIFFNDEVDEDGNGANRKMLVSVFNKLCDHDNLVTIETKVVGTQKAFYTQSTKIFMKWFLMMVLPIIYILLGVAVLIIRNKNLLIREEDGGKKNEQTAKEE